LGEGPATKSVMSQCLDSSQPISGSLELSLAMIIIS
jgi:hypothetical protein